MGSKREEHRIRAIDRVADGFVIHCACGWRSRPIDTDDVGTTWAMHQSGDG